MVEQLCRETNRTQSDIASRLIEFAFKNCEVVQNGGDGREE